MFGRGSTVRHAQHTTSASFKHECACHVDRRASQLRIPDTEFSSDDCGLSSIHG